MRSKQWPKKEFYTISPDTPIPSLNRALLNTYGVSRIPILQTQRNGRFVRFVAPKSLAHVSAKTAATKIAGNRTLTTKN
jgi:hypothetical protein